jgi:hypothetical protein
MKGIFDVKKSCEAQKALIEKNDYPFFPGRDGECYACGKNIYTEIKHEGGYTSGVDLHKASTELITGCPHCHTSYCE